MEDRGGPVPCIDGQIRNPVSRRWIKANGPTARRVFGANSCVPYCGERHPFEPLSHQQAAMDYFLTSEHQGLLLYFSLGLGKTCGSIMMMDALLEQDDIYQRVYVFSPGSLRVGFLTQYCTMCGGGNNHKIHFVTTNYSRIADVIPSVEDMSNSIIIMDEMHDVINGYRNGSATYVTLYNTLLQVRGSRFILLSGTPIAKDYLDMYYISKLLSPDMFPTVEDYVRYFSEGREDELKPLLQQIVSRVSIAENSEDHPQVTIRAQPVVISGDQLEQYYELKAWEERIFPPSIQTRIDNPALYKDQKSRFYIAYSMIKSRQLCNMYYPIQYVSDADLDMEYVQSLRINAPKLHIMINMINGIRGKHLAFSQFKNSYGVNAIARIFDLLNITYLMFTGDMNDADRADVTARFNARTNLHGEQYKVLLMTEAGAQGQNFLQVRRLYILEESIDELMLQQVIGRVNRYQSHIALPPNERNLTVVRFFATTGIATSLLETEQYRTSDMDAYQIGKKRMQLVSRMMTILNSLTVAPM